MAFLTKREVSIIGLNILMLVLSGVLSVMLVLIVIQALVGKTRYFMAKIQTITYICCKVPLKDRSVL